MKFETIIGLEIHVELATKSKIFCSCSTQFDSPPNKNICPICLGMPGTLPVLNKKVVALALKAGKILNCEINKISKFDRKSYFYPDLPKGYQITQLDLPLCLNGYLDIETKDGRKTIHINRIHIEEDAGKLVHLADQDISLADYNRAGIPLIEIVTEADFRTPEEVTVFLNSLRTILQYAEITDGKMEEGSLRCDLNISLRKKGSKRLNTKVEIKNLNSFREIYRALQAEEKRQKGLYIQGREKEIYQETRRWDKQQGKTIVMRSKNEAQAYQYFPELDLEPLVIDDDFIEEITRQIPELPQERKKRIIKQYGLDEQDAEILIGEKFLVDYFEKLVSYNIDPIEAANWIRVDLLRLIKDLNYSRGEIPLEAKSLAEIISLIQSGEISYTAGRRLFRQAVGSKNPPQQLLEEMGLSQISDKEQLEKIVDEILAHNLQAVEDYKNGKTRALGFIVGQAMKATKGKANPQLVKDIIARKLC